ncbi:HET-domain-containing protein [Stipitochalara longipes BDJ]|nr:HET-domain-containing protein [Stipitochalara longipes BDJ]
MRLLNVHTFKLHEFIGKDIPPYAILSHRWEAEEVTYQALRAGDGPRMKGWSKIDGCRKQAREDGFDYVWIDSCCIDKTSSAELSEAINSMFCWYQDADSCYAYLSDVCLTTSDTAMDGSDPEWIHSFHVSKWFTRGWTLQELLAPDNVIFFDKNWIELGTKESLEEHVTSITGIQDLSNFEKASVAQRFSWASRRETTRVEDAAYCLMGLFGVNMALLYGEGETAFMRLQLEILKISNDESIFAWRDPLLATGGLLAPAPACFRGSTDIECVHPQYLPRRPYTMTNNGLEFEAKLVRTSHLSGFRSEQTYMCLLNCSRQDDKSSLLYIHLSRRHGLSEQHFSRVYCGNLDSISFQDIAIEPLRKDDKPWSGTIFIQQPRLSLRPRRRHRPQSTFEFDTQQLSPYGFFLRGRYLENYVRGHWISQSIDHEILKLASYSTALIQFSRLGVSFLVRITCGASGANLGLRVLPEPGTAPEIHSLLSRTPIAPENWAKACNFVGHAVDFEVAKSNRISQSLRPCAEGSVVAVFQKKFAGRQYFDVKLSVED